MSDEAPKPSLSPDMREAILSLLRTELTITIEESYGYYESYELEATLRLAGEVISTAIISKTL